MNAGEPPAPPKPKASRLLNDAFERLRIPPTAQRVALGVLVFLGIYIGAVGLPIYVIQILQSHNFPVSISQTNVMYYGGAMAIFAAAQYAVKPYRAYGPVSIATNATELLYLWLLYQASPLSLSFGGGSGGGNGVTIAVGYTAVVLVLMLVTLLSMAGDAVTTYEDFSHPAERLYWTYPAR